MTEANTDQDCLFCKIVAGDIDADVVHESATTVAFRDLNPQAPTHVLVIPRSHYPNAASLADGEPETVVGPVRRRRGDRRRARASARATGWCSTPARRRTRPSSTPTCTCSAVAP